MSDVPPPPPPPPPGDMPPPPVVPPTSGPSTGVPIGDAFSWAWNKFTANIGAWIILALVVFVISIVGEVIIWLITLNIDAFLARWLVQSFFIGLLLVLQLCAAYGLYRAALGQTEGVTPTPGYAWKFDQFFNYAILAVIMGAILAVGYFICIIPGVIAWFLMLFAPYYVLNKNMAPFEAIKASVNVVSKNIGGLIGFVIVAGLVLFLGSACCIGILIAYPVALLASAFVFKRINGDTVAA